MSTPHLAATMPQQIIQINYRYSEDMPADREAYKEEKEEIAEGIAGFPGLQWKIWPFNKDRTEGGGIYLFEDEESAAEYKTSDYVEVLREGDKYEDIEVKQFELHEELSEITRGGEAISVDPVPTTTSD